MNDILVVEVTGWQKGAAFANRFDLSERQRLISARPFEPDRMLKQVRKNIIGRAICSSNLRAVGQFDAYRGRFFAGRFSFAYGAHPEHRGEHPGAHDSPYFSSRRAYRRSPAGPLS